MTLQHVLVVALVTVIGGSILFQLYQYHHFFSAGPRFTAADGQALCLRVRALEVAQGRPPLPCAYR